MSSSPTAVSLGHQPRSKNSRLEQDKAASAATSSVTPVRPETSRDFRLGLRLRTDRKLVESRAEQPSSDRLISSVLPRARHIISLEHN